jgi:hypothetical protein
MPDNPRSWREMRVVFICIAIAIGMAIAYNGLNADGYIPHSSQAVIYFPSDGWERGEYVLCGVKNFKGAKNQDPMLDCNNGDFSGAARVMDLRLWGIVGETDVLYQCRRNEETHHPYSRRKLSRERATSRENLGNAAKQDNRPHLASNYVGHCPTSFHPHLAENKRRAHQTSGTLFRPSDRDRRPERASRADRKAGR